MAAPRAPANYHDRFGNGKSHPSDAAVSGPMPANGPQAANKAVLESQLAEFQGLSRDFAAGLKLPSSNSNNSNSTSTPGLSSTSSLGDSPALTTNTTATTASALAAGLTAADLYPEFSSFDADSDFLKEKPFSTFAAFDSPRTNNTTNSSSTGSPSETRNGSSTGFYPPPTMTTIAAAPGPGHASKLSGGAASFLSAAESTGSLGGVGGAAPLNGHEYASTGYVNGSVHPPSQHQQRQLAADASSPVARLEAAAEVASIGARASPKPHTSASMYDSGPVSSASYYAPAASVAGVSSVPFGSGPAGVASGSSSVRPPRGLPPNASSARSQVAGADDDLDADAADTRGGGMRERPNSFFGLNSGQADADVAAASRPPRAPFAAASAGDSGSSLGGYASAVDSDNGMPSAVTGAAPPSKVGASAARPSSFFGAPDIGGGPVPGAETLQDGQTQAARIAAYHRGETLRSPPSLNESAAFHPGADTDFATKSIPRINTNVSQVSAASTPSTTQQHQYQQSLHQQQLSSGGGGPAAGRPASIAPSVATANGGAALLDHSHLRPGQQAALLSHGKTLELYRQNAKKTNDPNLIYEFAVFMIDASKTMGMDESGETTTDGQALAAKDDLIKEAIGLLKKIADRGHADAQYFLADCYANGISTPGNKRAFDKAYPLFVLAAKHGHPDAAYRAGTCQEKGWGCRKESGKALQFYRKAASAGHPGAMYRLATAELNGELGLKKSAKEGVKWLKRSAEAATAEFPHALHELALLHERGIDNVVFVDPEYACELLAQSAEMGYAPSAYKLGVNYEYGRMGCPQDGGLSIHMYNIAAQQNHKEACFALTAWYLVGAPGILPQSDTEAYLWAKKAGEQGLAKAEYAVGYFTEMGIGTVKDLREAKKWYRLAAEHGDRRANQRLAALDRIPDNQLKAGRPPGPVSANPISLQQQLPQGRPGPQPAPASRNFDPRLSQWIGDAPGDRRSQAGFPSHRQSQLPPPPPPMLNNGSRPQSMAPTHVPMQTASPIGPPPGAAGGFHQMPPPPMMGPTSPQQQTPRMMGGMPPQPYPQPGMMLPQQLQQMSPKDREEMRVQQRLAGLNRQQQQQQQPPHQMAQVQQMQMQMQMQQQPPPNMMGMQNGMSSPRLHNQQQQSQQSPPTNGAPKKKGWLSSK